LEEEYPVVEIDESLFSHITEDGVREQVWDLGIYDHGSDEFRMFVVPDRTSDTHIPVITDYVAPGTVIYTDGWRAYGGLGDLDYDDRVVLHVHGFGRGLDTTNGIESCWSQVKRLSNF